MKESQESIFERDVEDEAQEVVEQIQETVPEEKQEELAEKVVELAEEKPAKKEFAVIGSRQALEDVFKNAVPRISTGTKEHNPSKIKGDLQTKKNAAKREKIARSISKKSRKINRGK